MLPSRLLYKLTSCTERGRAGLYDVNSLRQIGETVIKSYTGVYKKAIEPPSLSHARLQTHARRPRAYIHIAPFSSSSTFHTLLARSPRLAPCKRRAGSTLIKVDNQLMRNKNSTRGPVGVYSLVARNSRAPRHTRVTRARHESVGETETALPRGRSNRSNKG